MASKKSPSLEEVWELFHEVAARFRETDAKFKETDAKFKETDANLKELTINSSKTDAIVAEVAKKVDKVTQAVTETSENVGGLSKKWGDLGEAMTIGETLPLFNAIDGIEVDDLYLNSQSKRGSKRREIDGIAVGDNVVIVIEAKTSLKREHIDIFINKTLKHFTEILSVANDKKIYGAIGFLSASSAAKAFAHKKGLLLICPVQGNKRLVPLPKDFKLRNFHPSRS